MKFAVLAAVLAVPLMCRAEPSEIGISPEVGIWISRAELATLPTSGPGWETLLRRADRDCGTPDLSDNNDGTNVCVMGKALLFARTGIARYRDDAVRAIRQAPETENGGRTLSLSRELAAYVIAADLVGLDPADDAAFRSWLDLVRFENLGGKTLVSTHEVRPNNWGTHACASRVAASLYLGDEADVRKAATVMRGWLGDRSAYAAFRYKDVSWQCDPEAPVGINPPGCRKGGFSIDGVMPDDQRRAGAFPAGCPGACVLDQHIWEALQGAVACAWMLSRHGYDVFEWQDKALLRAFRWLHEVAGWQARGDDRWLPYLLNRVYGSDFPTDPDAQPGKNVGWTDWTHQVR